jgi:hypothetical protein
MGLGGQRHAPTALPPRRSPGTRRTVSWVDPRTGLVRCKEEKISCPVASRFSDLCTQFTVDIIRDL